MDENGTDRSKVLDALESWILRVADVKTKATPEELEILPGIARAWLEHTAPAIKLL